MNGATASHTGSAANSLPPGVRMIRTGVVILRWNPVPGAKSYNVYRSLKSGAEGEKPYAKNVPAATYTDVGLTIGQTYYYKIAAVIPPTTSAQSGEISFVATAGNH